MKDKRENSERKREKRKDIMNLRVNVYA